MRPRLPIALAASALWACGLLLPVDDHNGPTFVEAGSSDQQTPDSSPSDAGEVPQDTDAGRDADADPVVDVAAGPAVSCAVRKSGRLDCWGSNDTMQLGEVPKSELRKCAYGAARTTTLPCRYEPRPVRDIANVQAVALGAFHACALHFDGSVTCWGGNQLGQTGAPPGGNVPCGTIMCSGPHRVELLKRATAIASAPAANHTCALLDDETVSCWGTNRSGELGRGHLGRQLWRSAGVRPG